MSARPQFCPLPAAAMGDDRLSGSHWRVLATIAYHDRFSANGAGCYAGATTLAREASVHPNNLARITSSLEQWGYLKVSRNPLNRRLKTYSLIYNDNRATLRENTKYRPDPGSPGADNKHEEGDTSSIHFVANAKFSHVSEKAQHNQELADVNIFPEGESKRSSEAKRDLTEARHSEGEQAEQQRKAHRQIVEGLGEELYAQALDAFSSASWGLICRLENETPGAGISRVLAVLKGEGV
jgi:DNA-binding MarR family transcriptional regulator